MAAGQSGLVVAFAQALTELTTVEKKNIVALTEIAADALRTEPMSAPSIATLIAKRVVMAPPVQKLPALYLLDSVSKTVGEPYKSLFVPMLAEAFMSTWHAGRSLHKALDKLLATWVGIFPQPVLDDIAAQLAAARAAAAPAHVQPPAGFAFLQTQPGFGGMPASMPQQPAAAALYQQAVTGAVGPQQPPLQQPPGLGGFPAAPGMQPGPYLQPPPQQQLQQPYAAAPPQAQQINVPDLLSSLMNAGLLTAPIAAPAAPAPATGVAAPELPHGIGNGRQQVAAPAPTEQREQPATTKFIPERLKEPNPSAVARLLRSTEATKSRFLDRKFLRRQQKVAGASARASRVWYLGLDTWMASTVGAAGTAGGAAGGVQAKPQQGAGAPEALDPSQFSVPVDDLQTHCALSGEQFEQFWDEAHQEWRYSGAKALDAEEAARYGLEPGAIVLVTALGAPAGGPEGGPGVLSELATQREIADDLAAAAAAADAGLGQEAAADVKDDKQLKQSLEEEEAAAAAAAAAAVAAEGEPPEKRQRVD